MLNNLRSKKIAAPNGLLIYLLGFYVLLQFGWWAYTLVNLNAEIYGLKLDLIQSIGIEGPELQVQKAELDEKLALRIWMVLGEGAVFVFILLLGFWSVRKSISKELMLAEQQKNFLLSITHELKSPLAAIKLQLQTLLTRNLPDEKKELIYKRALLDTDRLEKLVENLLLVNKVESGGLPLQKQSVDVSKMLRMQLQSVYPNLLEDGRIVLELEPNVFGEIDEMSFQSIMVNLIDNAIKYGAESTVSVSARMAKDSIEISVSDLGEGIPDSEKQKIFERFYRRGNEDVRKTKGTGIGLYLVQLLVEKYGGSISVEDNVPRGAIFHVRFPTVLA